MDLTLPQLFFSSPFSILPFSILDHTTLPQTTFLLTSLLHIHHPLILFSIRSCHFSSLLHSSLLPPDWPRLQTPYVFDFVLEKWRWWISKRILFCWHKPTHSHRFISPSLSDSLSLKHKRMQIHTLIACTYSMHSLYTFFLSLLKSLKISSYLTIYISLHWLEGVKNPLRFLPSFL